MPIGESQGMPSKPVLTGILVAIGAILFIVGVVTLPMCNGNALLFIALGIYLVGMGAGIIGGLPMYLGTLAFGTILLVLAYLVGHGVGGCGF
jgi:hypothetical protein